MGALRPRIARRGLSEGEKSGVGMRQFEHAYRRSLVCGVPGEGGEAIVRPDCRMESKELVVDEVSTWEKDRNETEAKIRWRFTIENARIKLEKLYPVFEYDEFKAKAEEPSKK
jgi:hypothetical protein